MACRHAGQSRGAATLIVIMVLFFVTTLVAAYTSRNMIFEQRTSANQYRATQAIEAADAGVEWATAMLNGGRIDPACDPSAVNTTSTFRDRYLDFNINGNISVKARVGGGWPTCVFDGTARTCICPDATDPALTPPPGAGPFAAFRVRMVVDSIRPGVVRVEVIGCTNLSIPPDCLNFPARATRGEGLATVTALIALKTGLTTPPAAPLTARGNVSVVPAMLLSALNLDTGSGGLTVDAGGNVAAADMQLSTLPGTPVESSVVANDPALAALTTVDPVQIAFYDDRMFATVFGMWRATYNQQSTVLTCPVDPCTTGAINTLLTLNPGRSIRINGALSVDADLGTAADPVLLVVSGNVAFGAGAANVYGLIYTRTGAVAAAGPTQVWGGIVSQADLVTTHSSAVLADALTVRYDANVLRRLRATHGSFIRVPGGWKDFE